jgi:hypothetical protein
LLTGCIFFYLEFEETSVMLKENTELENRKFVSKRFSPLLMRLFRFLQNRLIAMHECYFLMFTVAALL